MRNKEKNKDNKQIRPYVDDGHTVYNMQPIDEMRGRSRPKDGIGLNFKEKLALIRAAFSYYLPRLFLVLGCFALTILLIYFWLK